MPNDVGGGDFLERLRLVNSERLVEWENGNKADPLFHAAELGGEVGELLNVVKKLHREAMGWRGSRATLADLAEEIGDVLICLDKLAAQFGIDLAAATTAKFNKTSLKVGLPHTLGEVA
jgi:NTP pyrophosphatase (non-canonical NTP hydrolase)